MEVGGRVGLVAAARLGDADPRPGGGPGGGGAGREEMREQMTAMRTEQEKKLQEVLTPAQYTELQKMEDEDGGGGRRGGRQGRGP